jgi:hypothetical protein
MSKVPGQEDYTAPIVLRASRTPSIFLVRVGVTRVADTLALTVLVGLAAVALSLLAGWLLHP